MALNIPVWNSNCSHVTCQRPACPVMWWGCLFVHLMLLFVTRWPCVLVMSQNLRYSQYVTCTTHNTMQIICLSISWLMHSTWWNCVPSRRYVWNGLLRLYSISRVFNPHWFYDLWNLSIHTNLSRSVSLWHGQAYTGW